MRLGDLSVKIHDLELGTKCVIDWDGANWPVVVSGIKHQKMDSGAYKVDYVVVRRMELRWSPNGFGGIDTSFVCSPDAPSKILSVDDSDCVVGILSNGDD